MSSQQQRAPLVPRLNLQRGDGQAGAPQQSAHRPALAGPCGTERSSRIPALPLTARGAPRRPAEEPPAPLRSPLSARGQRTAPAFPRLDARQATPRSLRPPPPQQLPPQQQQHHHHHQQQQQPPGSARGPRPANATAAGAATTAGEGASPLPTPRGSYRDALTARGSRTDLHPGEAAGRPSLPVPPPPSRQRSPSPLRPSDAASAVQQGGAPGSRLPQPARPQPQQAPGRGSGAGSPCASDGAAARQSSRLGRAAGSPAAAGGEPPAVPAPATGEPPCGGAPVQQQQLQRAQQAEAHAQRQVHSLESGLASLSEELGRRLGAVQALSEQREALATQVAAAQQLCQEAKRLEEARQAEVQALELAQRSLSASLEPYKLHEASGLPQRDSARGSLLGLMLTAARMLHAPELAAAVQRELASTTPGPPAGSSNPGPAAAAATAAVPQGSPAVPPLRLGGCPAGAAAAGCSTGFNTPAGSVTAGSGGNSSSSSGESESDSDDSQDNGYSSSGTSAPSGSRLSSPGQAGEITARLAELPPAGSPTRPTCATAAAAGSLHKVPPLQLCLAAASGCPVRGDDDPAPQAKAAPPRLTVLLPTPPACPAGLDGGSTAGEPPRSPLSPLALQRLQRISRKLSAAEDILSASALGPALQDQNVLL